MRDQRARRPSGAWERFGDEFAAHMTGSPALSASVRSGNRKLMAAITNTPVADIRHAARKAIHTGREAERAHANGEDQCTAAAAARCTNHTAWTSDAVGSPGWFFLDCCGCPRADPTSGKETLLHPFRTIGPMDVQAIKAMVVAGEFPDIAACRAELARATSVIAIVDARIATVTRRLDQLQEPTPRASWPLAPSPPPPLPPRRGGGVKPATRCPSSATRWQVATPPPVTSTSSPRRSPACRPTISSGWRATATTSAPRPLSSTSRASAAGWRRWCAGCAPTTAVRRLERQKGGYVPRPVVDRSRRHGEPGHALRPRGRCSPAGPRPQHGRGAVPRVHARRCTTRPVRSGRKTGCRRWP